MLSPTQSRNNVARIVIEMELGAARRTHAVRAASWADGIGQDPNT